MIKKKKMCAMLMRISPTFPGLLDESETSERHMTSQYQCLKTISPVGPDHDTVNPQQCTGARGCYKEA
ncbi:hypothetical protein JW998_15200 [candidate division KSB1 bacterium]|nr:hypothetical protein [candidate division KSB1 bacterium]